MRRRPILLAVAAASLPLVALLPPGCGSDEAPLENICGWIQDPENCYRTFYDEIRTRCGAQFDAAADELLSEPKGAFPTRDQLDVCLLDSGGQVVFDPALDLNTFPLTTVAFTRLTALSDECGTFSSSAENAFLVRIAQCNEDTMDDIPRCKDELSSSTSVSGDGKNPDEVAGGTFQSTTPEGRQTYDTYCRPGTTPEEQAERHHFNGIEIEKCTGYEALLPRVEIESRAGGTFPPGTADQSPYQGYVRFRVYYPPPEGSLEGAQPEVVQYFNCTIPAQNPCKDGFKNYDETDVDCGGPFCEACETGQICKDNSDCKSGNCVLDPNTQFNLCEDAVSGAGGAGGTGGAGGAGGGSGGAGG